MHASSSEQEHDYCTSFETVAQDEGTTFLNKKNLFMLILTLNPIPHPTKPMLDPTR